MPTATPVLADLLDAIVHRLSDIATDLRSDLSSPALAEVRAAIAAAERAFVLLSPWVPHTEDSEHEDILAEVQTFVEGSNGGIQMPHITHFQGATIDATALEGADNYIRVTMPGCVYLLTGEDEGDGLNWRVEGRYPQ